VATARGIQVALAKNTTVSATSDWLPGFFKAGDGTYVPFDPNSILVSSDPLPPPPDPDAGPPGDGGNGGEGGTPDAGADAGPDAGLQDAGPIVADAGFVPPFPYALAIPDGGTIPFPQDAGFVAADFDSHGTVLFTRPGSTRGSSDVIALGEPINGPRPATGYSIPFTLDVLQPDGTVLGPVLTRMDDLVCIPDVVNGAPTNGCSGFPATHTVGCVQPSTGQLVIGTGDNNGNPALDLAGPTPGGTAGAFDAVRTYFAPNDTATICGPTWSVFAFPQSAFVPQQRNASAFAGCTVLSVNRLLPVVDGSFAVGVNLDCGVAAALPRWVVLQVSAAGAITGSYLAKVGVPLASQPQVLGVLQGGTFGTISAVGAIVTMRNDPPYTTFEAWLPDGAGPVATARVPGLFVYASAASRLGSNVKSATDGSLSALLGSATLGDVVLHIGPGLHPRWLYRYPRVVLTPSALIGDPSVGNVYYVDPTNNDIVALKRF